MDFSKDETDKLLAPQPVDEKNAKLLTAVVIGIVLVIFAKVVFEHPSPITFKVFGTLGIAVAAWIVYLTCWRMSVPVMALLRAVIEMMTAIIKELFRGFRNK